MSGGVISKVVLGLDARFWLGASNAHRQTPFQAATIAADVATGPPVTRYKN